MRPPFPLPPGARPVRGFPCYCVTRTGRVYSCRVYGSRVRRLGPWWEMKLKGSNREGYLYVDLFRKAGKPERFQVQWLVAEAFIGPRLPGRLVCHWNDDKRDNRSCNLYYGTKRTNIRDAIRNGKFPTGENVYNAKLTNEEVREIRRLRRAGRRAVDIAAAFGITKSSVRKILARRTYGTVT